MNIIRQRVRLRAGSFDNAESLLFKAFLISEKTENHNKYEENCYSPFYLWSNTKGMTDFIMSDSFKAVPKSFGQPVINHWCCMLNEFRSRHIQNAEYASREVLKVSSYIDFGKLKIKEKTQTEFMIQSGALAVVTAFEPRTWTLVRFCLWESLPGKTLSNSHAKIYQALHISAPQ
jgi:hypothetical protein